MTVVDVELKEKELIKTGLVKQEDALSVYLQSLLGKPVVEIIQEKTQGKFQKKIVNESFKAEVVSAKNPEPIIDAKNKIPHWAVTQTNEIKCLSANVGGMYVLIPAEYISSIKNVTNRLTPSSAMPVWVYELADDEDAPIQVVNTKKLVFGGVKSHQIQSNARTYAVLLDDGAWGISCDSIGEVVKLKPSDITWRSESGKRHWLAGTSRFLGAIVLDVKRIEKALIS